MKVIYKFNHKNKTAEVVGEVVGETATNFQVYHKLSGKLWLSKAECTLVEEDENKKQAP